MRSVNRSEPEARRGRPLRGTEPSATVTVRLTTEELQAVEARSEREEISRSEAIRWALAEWLTAHSERKGQAAASVKAAVSPGPLDPRRPVPCLCDAGQGRPHVHRLRAPQGDIR